MEIRPDFSDDATDPEILKSMRESFTELVRDFFRQADCELPYYDSDPDRALQFEADVNGVGFAVTHRPEGDPQALFITCRLGPLPAVGAAAATRELLELNTALAYGAQASFGIDADTGDVLYVHAHRLETASATSLHDAMVTLAGQAAQWRERRLQGEPINADPSGALPGLARSGTVESSWRP